MGKPEIRFKGYTDEWEQRKLGDIADVTKLAGFEFTEHVVYSDEGNIIALRGLNIKNGQLILDDVKYIDGSNFSKLSRSKLFVDDIMFTYVGTVGEVAIIKENDRFYLAPNVSRIRVKSDDSPKFISHYMRTDNFKNKVIFPLIATSSQPALSMENVRKFTINISINREEQDCLAKYFDSLDHLITLHQRKCDEVKSLKKYMLQKMFPQNEQKVPEIRFEGFTEAWEQRKLGELYQRNTERNENLIGYDKTISVATMSYKDDGNGASESSLSTYKVLRVGDIAFEGHTNKQFRFGRFVVNDIGTGIMSPRFSTLRPLNEIPVNFWKQYIHSESVMRRILVNSTKAGTMMNELVIPEFLNQTIMVPSENEQAVIGQYFTNLDHLITLHQQKCEELKKIKKFMLQKMFV